MLKRLRATRIYLILLLAVSLFGAQFAHAANTSPIAVGTIPDKTFKVNETYTVDLSGYFNDGDGDTLTYTASSGDTTIATVSVSSATLTVTAVAVGSVTIEATATDPDSEDATQEFTVTVQAAANTAPTTVGTMDDHDLLLGASTVTVEASLYFTDEDVEALSYTATSSDTAVATTKCVVCRGDREPRRRRHCHDNRHGDGLRGVECDPKFFGNGHCKPSTDCRRNPRPSGGGKRHPHA